MFINHTFYLQNEPVEANVSVESNRIQQMFRVAFKNGYENIFFKDVETGQWVEEDLGFTQLAAEVGKTVLPFHKQPIHVPKVLVWHLEDYHGHFVKFGFYAYTKGEQKMYEIYHHNKKYLYTLLQTETDEWQVFGSGNAKIPYLDKALLDAIVGILPIYEEDYH